MSTFIARQKRNGDTYNVPLELDQAIQAATVAAMSEDDAGASTGEEKARTDDHGKGLEGNAAAFYKIAREGDEQIGAAARSGKYTDAGLADFAAGILKDVEKFADKVGPGIVRGLELWRKRYAQSSTVVPLEGKALERATAKMNDVAGSDPADALATLWDLLQVEGERTFATIGGRFKKIARDLGYPQLADLVDRKATSAEAAGALAFVTPMADRAEQNWVQLRATRSTTPTNGSR